MIWDYLLATKADSGTKWKWMAVHRYHGVSQDIYISVGVWTNISERGVSAIRETFWSIGELTLVWVIYNGDAQIDIGQQYVATDFDLTVIGYEIQTTYVVCNVINQWHYTQWECFDWQRMTYWLWVPCNKTVITFILTIKSICITCITSI